MLFISSASFATPMMCTGTNPEDCLNSNDVASEFYITKDGYDWVWASFVNTQFSFEDQNELKLPTYNGRNWMFATTAMELEALFSLTLADFTRPDGTIIEGTEYWNTGIHGVDIDNLIDKEISSVWVINQADPKFYYDTFYVRKANVPEPTTLLIFAAGLVGFALRKRNVK